MHMYSTAGRKRRYFLSVHALKNDKKKQKTWTRACRCYKSMNKRIATKSVLAAGDLFQVFIAHARVGV